MIQLQRKLNDLISDVADQMEYETDLEARGNLIIAYRQLNTALTHIKTATINETKAVNFLVSEGYTLDENKEWQSPSNELPNEAQNECVLYLMWNHGYKGTYFPPNRQELSSD